MFSSMRILCLYNRSLYYPVHLSVEHVMQYAIVLHVYIGIYRLGVRSKNIFLINVLLIHNVFEKNNTYFT